MVIEIEKLTKSYGRTRALDGVNLSVPEGQILGFLGPNGAGKSTTIRILLGLLRADGGSARLWGRDAWTDAVALHRRMAYVPGDVALWPNLTGGEAIDVMGRLRGGFDPARRAALIEHFALDPAKRCGTYSTGNRQKVAIIAALAGDADLLILDEPTSGLDPLMEAAFAAAIEEERERGRTILLSSHTLAQVERLADEIAIIRAGRIVETGSLAELRHLTRSSVRARTERPVPGLASRPGVHGFAETDGELSFDVDAEALGDVVGELQRAGLTSLVSQPPSLEDLFLRHYGEEK